MLEVPEIAARRDAALLRALSTPHKKQADMKKGVGRASTRSKLDVDGFRKSVAGFLSFLSDTNQLARIETNAGTAAGTDDPVVRFKPSDSLSHFVRALGALEFDASVAK